MKDENSSLYCLEAVRDVGQNRESRLFLMLEHLAREHDIVNVYQSCDTIAGFEQSLNNLLYEDRNFGDYEVLYLVVRGSQENIEIEGYRYSLAEIAELFEGKLKGKLIHFSNSKTLDIDLETAQYFLDVTGAKALSGYIRESATDSLTLDAKIFAYYQQQDDPEKLVQELLDDYNLLCAALGFRLFY